MIVIKILFDETQKERGRIFSNFKILAHDLEQLGFKIGVYDSYPIKYSSIKDIKVLAFLCPDGSKLYAHEIKGLIRFVEEGGGLAIFANAGGDSGLNTNLNSLLKHFNIELVSNQVFDYFNFDVELERCPVVTKIFPHPVTENVKELTFVTGCSLAIGYDVIELARTQTSSTPPSATILAAKIYGKGKIVVCGSYMMFSDREAGINLRDNRTLASNIFKWLAAPITPKDTTATKLHGRIDERSPKVKKLQEGKKQVSKGITSKISTLKHDEKVQQAQKTKAVPTLTEDEIAEGIKIIKEIEAEIESMGIIDDPSYKEIILTDMARRRGIDYNIFLPYLETEKGAEELGEAKAIEVPEQMETKEAVGQEEMLSKALSERESLAIKSKQIKIAQAVQLSAESPPMEKETSTSKILSREELESERSINIIKTLNDNLEHLTVTITAALNEIVNELKEIKEYLKGEKE